jgi:hypothetical protein
VRWCGAGSAVRWFVAGSTRDAVDAGGRGGAGEGGVVVSGLHRDPLGSPSPRAVGRRRRWARVVRVDRRRSPPGPAAGRGAAAAAA